MPFVPWSPPEQAVLEFRAIAVYLEQLLKEQTRVRNQLHAASATATVPQWVADQLRKRVDELEAAVGEAIAKMEEHADTHPVLAEAVARLIKIRGIS